MTPLLAQRSRSDRSFERLYRRHVGDVYHYALAVMRNRADAEDVTQTTFLNAYRAFERGERPQKPHNWLITIAHNVCRQRFRQSARRPTEVEFDDDVGERFVDNDEDAAPNVEDIRRALGHLAFNQRAALVMRELEGRSYAEIADILELSPSAVETLLFRARRALREQLEFSLTCGEAELAISRQLDGRLSRQEKGAVRAHLRECKECATFARRQRAQRAALRSLAAVPVPASLTSLFGGGATVGGGAALGGGVLGGLAAKVAVAVTAAAVVGAGYEGVHTAVTRHHAPRANPAASSRAERQSSTAASPVASPATSTHKHAVVGRASDAAPPQRGHVRHRGVVAHASPGDASISARHAHSPSITAHPPHPVHPAQSASTTYRHGNASHARSHQPPGPDIGGPTSPGSNGNGNGGGGQGKGSGK